MEILTQNTSHFGLSHRLLSLGKLYVSKRVLSPNGIQYIVKSLSGDGGYPPLELGPTSQTSQLCNWILSEKPQ